MEAKKIAKYLLEKKLFDKVKKEVEGMHSYSVPCIIKIPVSSNKAYFNWLIGELG